MSLPPDAADPVFVGGAGRSGTHAGAQLIGAHSRYRYVNREIRFHTDKGGFPDLLAGRVGTKRFLSRMRGHWWHRNRPKEREGGLHGLVSEEDFERALSEFERTFEADRIGASRTLMSTLLDPLAAESGKPSWVEQSTRTVAAAPTLTAIFPRCKLVHMVRDGRDVAASLVNRPWGPDSLLGGLARWERQLRAADAGARELASARLLQVNLEDLVVGDREGTYRKVLDFLAIDDEAGMREHFDNKMVPGKANLARWQIDLSDSQQQELTSAYLRSLESLSRDRVASADDLARRAGLTQPRRRTGSPLSRRLPSLFRR